MNTQTPPKQLSQEARSDVIAIFKTCNPPWADPLTEKTKKLLFRTLKSHTSYPIPSKMIEGAFDKIIIIEFDWLENPIFVRLSENGEKVDFRGAEYDWQNKFGRLLQEEYLELDYKMERHPFRKRRVRLTREDAVIPRQATYFKPKDYSSGRLRGFLNRFVSESLYQKYPKLGYICPYLKEIYNDYEESNGIITCEVETYAGNGKFKFIINTRKPYKSTVEGDIEVMPARGPFLERLWKSGIILLKGEQ